MSELDSHAFSPFHETAPLYEIILSIVLPVLRNKCWPKSLSNCRKIWVERQLGLRIRKRRRRRSFPYQPSPNVLDRDPFACVLSGSHSLPGCATPALGGPGVE